MPTSMADVDGVHTWKFNLDVVSRGVSAANNKVPIPFNSSPWAFVLPAASAVASFSSIRSSPSRLV